MPRAEYLLPRAVTTVSLLLFLSLAARAQSNSWVSTASRAVGPFLVNAIPEGPLTPSAPLHIAVGLKLRNQAALVQYAKAVNDPSNALFGNWLTDATDSSAPSPGTTT